MQKTLEQARPTPLELGVRYANGTTEVEVLSLDIVSYTDIGNPRVLCRVYAEEGSYEWPIPAHMIGETWDEHVARVAREKAEREAPAEERRIAREALEVERSKHEPRKFNVRQSVVRSYSASVTVLARTEEEAEELADGSDALIYKLEDAQREAQYGDDTYETEVTEADANDDVHITWNAEEEDE